LSADLAETLRAAASRAPCIASLGLSLESAEPGACTIRARHDPRFDGLLPGFHGGMMAAVADCVAWYAIATRIGPRERLVTTDLSLRYLNPCQTDLLAKGRVIKLGRTLCPVQIDLFDLEQQPVATGIVTYLRVDALNGAQPAPRAPENR